MSRSGGDLASHFTSGQCPISRPSVPPTASERCWLTAVEKAVRQRRKNTSIIRPDGTIRWIWDRGYPIRDEFGTRRVSRRNSRRHHRAEAGRASISGRRGAVSHAGRCDAGFDLGPGTDKLCNYFNKQWLDFTGRSAEEEMGDGWTQSVHPDDLRSMPGNLPSNHSTRRQPFTIEYRLNARATTIAGSWTPGSRGSLRTARFHGYIGSCIDITDRKRVEEELRQSDRRKEEFLAVLSHELRNPLAPIQTAVDFSSTRGTSQAGSERPLAMIKRQVGSLKRLVDDLLDISRISRGKIELRKELVRTGRRGRSGGRRRPTALRRPPTGTSRLDSRRIHSAGGGHDPPGTDPLQLADQRRPVHPTRGPNLA